ncbi:hypothetical protein J5N97_005411 [Dioscorea zingiberensis]|uniref:AN1-type domain-containing protein n=1 Tax=Dioscorea zingiberensis TaxID=325984 RepID=A0A9D5DAF0_9LILI|nr:hypothetical protein J5N97_005411 [Dioscorea zingiberensis]
MVARELTVFLGKLVQGLGEGERIIRGFDSEKASGELTTWSIRRLVARLQRAQSTGPTRCNACKKRVGLTGFNCRCGNIFCAVHRYSDKHSCPFDYRMAARDAIARANPVQCLQEEGWADRVQLQMWEHFLRSPPLFRQA